MGQRSSREVDGLGLTVGGVSGDGDEEGRRAGRRGEESARATTGGEVCIQPTRK